MSDPNPKENKTGGVMPYDLFFLKSNIFPEESINIEPLVNEIFAQKRYFPFAVNGKEWLWCPTMPKHQIICHPSLGKYPNPPIELQEEYKSGKLFLSQNITKLKRTELEKPQYYWETYSRNCQDLLKAVYKEFGVYQFLTKLYKDKKIIIPEEVLVKICESYFKNKPMETDWGWFIVVTQKEWESWNSAQNEKDSKEREKEARAPIAPAIAEIIKGMAIAKSG